MITAVVGLVAIIVIGGFQAFGGSGSAGQALPGTRTADGILIPALATPPELVRGRAIGPETAPVRLTVWSDFQCPACRAFAQTVEPRLIADYVQTGRLRIEYRDLLIIGPESRVASIASRCADRQGQFWPYHDVLFANQAAENSGALTPLRLAAMARAADLEVTQFAACQSDPQLATDVDAESLRGRTVATSTPTLDFGSVVIAGVPPYAQLAARVDALLAEAGPAK